MRIFRVILVENVQVFFNLDLDYVLDILLYRQLVLIFRLYHLERHFVPDMVHRHQLFQYLLFRCAFKIAFVALDSQKIDHIQICGME